MTIDALFEFALHVCELHVVDRHNDKTGMAAIGAANCSKYVSGTIVAIRAQRVQNDSLMWVSNRQALTGLSGQFQESSNINLGPGTIAQT